MAAKSSTHAYIVLSPTTPFQQLCNPVSAVDEALRPLVLRCGQKASTDQLQEEVGVVVLVLVLVVLVRKYETIVVSSLNVSCSEWPAKCRIRTNTLGLLSLSTNNSLNFGRLQSTTPSFRIRKTPQAPERKVSSDEVGAKLHARALQESNKSHQKGVLYPIFA